MKYEFEAFAGEVIVFSACYLVSAWVSRAYEESRIKVIFDNLGIISIRPGIKKMCRTGFISLSVFLMYLAISSLAINKNLIFNAIGIVSMIGIFICYLGSETY